MYPIAFSIGKIHIYNHGLLMVVGALCGSLIVFQLAHKNKLNTDFLYDLLIYTLLAGLLGARILYIILYFHEFSNWREIFFVWSGGLVSFGGIAGGIICAYAILKIKGEKIAEWFDLAGPAILIGWAIGRIGCLLNGDSVGILSSSRYAIWGRIPSQLYESIGCLIAFIFIYYLMLKKKQLKLTDGIIFWTSIASYGLVRFIVDFWRDEPQVILLLKTGQIGSIIIFALAAFFIYYLLRGKKVPIT